MKFYVDITTNNKKGNLNVLTNHVIGSQIPLAITITNREYAKLEYYGKWDEFKKIIEDYKLERYNFRKEE